MYNYSTPGERIFWQFLEPVCNFQQKRSPLSNPAKSSRVRLSEIQALGADVSTFQVLFNNKIKLS